MVTLDRGMHYTQALEVQPAIITSLPPKHRFAIIVACPGCPNGEFHLIVIQDGAVETYNAGTVVVRRLLMALQIPLEGWKPCPLLAEYITATHAATADREEGTARS